MHAPQESLRDAPLEHVRDKPRDEHPDAETYRRSESERPHVNEPERPLGRDAGSGKLFAVELVAAQIAWLALIALAVWLLLH